MTAHLVYVAGPYAKPDPVLNTREATGIALGIYEATGAGVIIPHLSLLAHAMFPHDEDFWYEFDFALLDRCTCLYRIPGESKGTDAEEARARTRGIPVFVDQPGALLKFLRT